MQVPRGVRTGTYRASVPLIPPEYSRTLASSGYWLVYVGREHPMADVRGYAYEHRLVAAQIAGRPLRTREYVHHKNNDSTDNRPENLEIMDSATHRFHHRRPGSSRRRDLGEPNAKIGCACGCGTFIARYDRWNRPRLYAPLHFRPPGQQPVPPQEDFRRQTAYEDARNDAEAAGRLGLSYEGFRRWRLAKGLPRKEFVRPRGTPICPRCGTLRTIRHPKDCARRGMRERIRNATANHGLSGTWWGEG